MPDIASLVTFLAWTAGSGFCVIAGMGAGIIALPLMLLFCPPDTTIVASCLIGVSQCLSLLFRFRKSVQWKLALLLIAGNIPGTLLGVWVLKTVEGVFLKTGIGLLFLLALAGQFVNGEGLYFGERTKRALIFLFGGLSGFSGGAVGINGPPLAFGATLLNWNKDLARGTFAASFTFNLIAASLLDYTQGLLTPEAVRLACWGIPGVLLGFFIGLPLSYRINQATFRACLNWITAASIFFLAGEMLIG